MTQSNDSLNLEPCDPLLQDELYGLGGPDVKEVAEFNRAIAGAFRARADVRMERGEYHLAIADYGRALNTSPLGDDFERDPEANERRLDAQGKLGLFFHCGGDINRLPEVLDSSVREAVRATRLPDGHLVVAEDGGVLAAFSLTAQGRSAAIAFANDLADDEYARFGVDNRYLAENDDFDAVVYACENGGAIEVYRASPKEESTDIDPEQTPQGPRNF